MNDYNMVINGCKLDFYFYEKWRKKFLFAAIYFGANHKNLTLHAVGASDFGVRRGESPNQGLKVSLINRISLP